MQVLYDKEALDPDCAAVTERYFQAIQDQDFDAYKACIFPVYYEHMEQMLQTNYQYGMEQSFRKRCAGFLGEGHASYQITSLQMEYAAEESLDSYFSSMEGIFGAEFQKDIQDAMEKQMRAERERREAILRAEGEKRSQILIAEGKKESQILNAEAEKQAAILLAEAEKEKKIREGQGEAESIMLVQKAQADAIRLLNEACPSKEVLTLKAYESFMKAADGQATKIIIPSEIQGMAGLAASVKELVKE